MSVEQHAEAAAMDISADLCWDTRSPLGPTVAIIARHMMTAIDEATATLKARVAALEGLEPLIDVYGDYCEGVGRYDGHEEAMKKREIWREITAILKGGAP